MRVNRVRMTNGWNERRKGREGRKEERKEGRKERRGRK